MGSGMSCSCGERHKGHLCVLKSRGLTDEIAHLTDNPAVSCFTCDAAANSADSV